MKTFLGVSALLGAVALAPMTAEASCAVSGVIQRVNAYTGGSANTIYIRSGGPLGTLYIFTTVDDMLTTAAINAVTSQVDMYVVNTGAVPATCPAGGGSAGAVSYMYVNP